MLALLWALFGALALGIGNLCAFAWVYSCAITNPNFKNDARSLQDDEKVERYVVQFTSNKSFVKEENEKVIKILSGTPDQPLSPRDGDLLSRIE